MDEILLRKEEASKLMSEQKFSEAAEMYLNISNQINPTTDKEALIKSICLLNRSICNLNLQNEIDAMDDANKVINTIQSVRKDLKLSEISSKNDPLMSVVSLAEYRKGQIYEALGDFLSALKSFTLSNKIAENEEAKSAIESIYLDLGLPHLDKSDKDLTLFCQIFENLPSKSGILNILSELLSLFQEKDIIKPEILDKFAEKGCHLFIFGTMQMHMRDPLVCATCMTIARHFVENGIQDTFDGLPVVASALEEHISDIDVVTSAIRFCVLAPSNQISSVEGLPSLFVQTLRCKIPQEDVDFNLTILYNLTLDKRAFEELSQTDIVDAAFSRKCNSSVFLISRLVVDPKLCAQASDKGCLALALNILRHITDQAMLAKAMIMAAHVFIIHPPGSEGYVELIVEAAVPAVTKNSKAAEIAMLGFSLLSVCAGAGGVDALRRTRAVRVASLVLLVHADSEPVVRSIVGFMFAACVNGLCAEVAEAPNAVTKILETMTKYTASQEIVEKGIAVAFFTGHPKASALIAFGLKHFPQSPILAGLTS